MGKCQLWAVASGWRGNEEIGRYTSISEVATIREFMWQAGEQHTDCAALSSTFFSHFSPPLTLSWGGGSAHGGSLSGQKGGRERARELFFRSSLRRQGSGGWPAWTKKRSLLRNTYIPSTTVEYGYLHHFGPSKFDANISSRTLVWI